MLSVFRPSFLRSSRDCAQTAVTPHSAAAANSGLMAPPLKSADMLRPRSDGSQCDDCRVRLSRCRNRSWGVLRRLLLAHRLATYRGDRAGHRAQHFLAYELEIVRILLCWGLEIGCARGIAVFAGTRGYFASDG